MVKHKYKTYNLIAISSNVFLAIIAVIISILSYYCYNHTEEINISSEFTDKIIATLTELLKQDAEFIITLTYLLLLGICLLWLLLNIVAILCGVRIQFKDRGIIATDAFRNGAVVIGLVITIMLLFIPIFNKGVLLLVVIASVFSFIISTKTGVTYRNELLL